MSFWEQIACGGWVLSCIGLYLLHREWPIPGDKDEEEE